MSMPMVLPRYRCIAMADCSIWRVTSSLRETAPSMPEANLLREVEAFAIVGSRHFAGAAAHLSSSLP
jgi:hypothetical protein